MNFVPYSVLALRIIVFNKKKTFLIFIPNIYELFKLNLYYEFNFEMNYIFFCYK